MKDHNKIIDHNKGDGGKTSEILSRKKNKRDMASIWDQGVLLIKRQSCCRTETSQLICLYKSIDWLLIATLTFNDLIIIIQIVIHFQALPVKSGMENRVME